MFIPSKSYLISLNIIIHKKNKIQRLISQIYTPCELLQPYIHSFVIQEIADECEYKVLPDTGLVIGFQYKGDLFYLHDKNEVPLSHSGITGLCGSYRIFRNSADTGTVLAIFKEAGASVFFKQPLHELFNESISLDNFMFRSELLLLEEQLCEAKTDPERITIVEKFLLSRITHTEPDPLVLAALSLIHKSKGDIRIRELVKQLHISQSPLEKKFRQAVGTSPKKYASVVRMKNVIQQYVPGSSLTSLGYEAGFYDQAHFIRVFKTFTGDTPESFFSK
jgi:AraC-like DNA-binding protein